MGIIDKVKDNLDSDPNKPETEPEETFQGQEFEYLTINLERELGGIGSTKAKDPETRLNWAAKDGWRLVDTINEDNGGTQFLVLERES